MEAQVEVDGSTIDEAIEKGLAKLGVPREEAAVDILQDARRGILGFGGQRARVRVRLRERLANAEANRRTVEAEQPAVSRPSLPPVEARRADSPAPANGLAAPVLGDILRLMDLEATVDTTESEDGQVARVATESSALVIGRHGQTLDALEYLLNRILSKREERAPHVVVDCEGYRERRRRELRDMAERLAERARHRGRAETTSELTPRDRRIVHMALGGRSGVTTRSIGDGFLRRVVIAPSREPR